LFQGSTTPAQLACCIALGVFCGILPVWGFQGALALVLAQRLKLSRVLALLASNISMPIFVPVIVYLSILTGHAVVTGEIDPTLAVDSLDPALAGAYAVEYFVGSAVFAVIASAIAAFITFALSFAGLRMWRSE
jgi:uncharacterized protein (DUF2062 family)